VNREHQAGALANTTLQPTSRAQRKPRSYWSSRAARARWWISLQHIKSEILN